MKETLSFESYTTKSGETKGKPWKLFLLKTEDGRTFSTFDIDLVKIRTPMEIEYEEETTNSGFTRRRIISPEKEEKLLEMNVGQTPEIIKAINEAKEEILKGLREVYKRLPSENVDPEEIEL